jgi:MFS family permease
MATTSAVGAVGTEPAGIWAPLRHRHFRHFFSAAVVSNVGAWMQSVATPFVVYDLTRSEAWLGASAFITMIVGTLANTPGGLLADRFDRRLVLTMTQALQMVAAGVLCVLFVIGEPAIATVLGLMVLSSLGAGLNSPAWSSIIPTLVPRGELPGAIRLNSMQFALSRTLGPLLGGVLLKAFGPAVCYGVNAVTYPVLIVAVLAVPARAGNSDGQRLTLRRAVRDVADGWRYLASDRVLVYPPLATLVIAGFGFGMTSLAPALADIKLGRLANDNGSLLAAFGVGGLVGVFAGSVLARRVRPGAQMLLVFAGWIGGTVLLAATGVFGVGLAALALMGMVHGHGGITLNTVMQAATTDAYRGRVMGSYLQMFFLGSALGSLLLGLIAEHWSLTAAVLTSTVVFVAFGLVSIVAFDRLRLLDDVREAPLRAGSPGG